MMVKVKIRRLQGNDEEIIIDDQCTVLELKQQLFNRLGIEPSLQRLIFCGHVLDDNINLAEYNIDDDKVIHMVMRPPPETTRSGLPNPLLAGLNNALGQAASGSGNHINVTHGDQVNLSPTAIRLRILTMVVRELRRGIQELDSQTDADSNFDLPIDQGPVAVFSRLISEVHSLDRRFDPHRANYLSILHEVRGEGNVRPLDERSVQARMRFSEQINAIFHNLSHAFHLISDIAILESPERTLLASEAFLRQPQNHTPSVDGHAGRTANIDGNINGPFNVAIDPIMIQLQIETSETPTGQRNEDNNSADVDMEVDNASPQNPQDQRYNAQEYLRNLEQRMRSTVQPPDFDLGMELDDLPVGPANLQDLLRNQPNIVGADQNAPSPMIGSLSADFIQQIVSSVIRNEISDVNWPNSEQGATQNASGPNRPNANNGENPNRPPTGPPRPPETRRIPIWNVVYDQATPCESRHTRRALHLRSGINPAEFPMPHNEAASTRAFFTVQSLYDRFDRNPRSPDSLVIAYFLILREALVPGTLRYLSTQELLQVGDSVTEHFGNLLHGFVHDNSAQKITDIIMNRHSKFLRRLPFMVNMSQRINLTMSLHAVILHHMPSILNLITVRDSGDFCRALRLSVPPFFQDLCVVLYNVVEYSNVALETVLRAYLIECLGDMEETNRDLLLNIAFYCMSSGIYRANIATEPSSFIVLYDQPRPPPAWYIAPQPSTSGSRSNVDRNAHVVSDSNSSSSTTLTPNLGMSDSPQVTSSKTPEASSTRPATRVPPSATVTLASMSQQSVALPSDSLPKEPQSGQPQSGQPQSGQPQSRQPQSGQPQSGQPQSGQSRLVEAHSSGRWQQRPRLTVAQYLATAQAREDADGQQTVSSSGVNGECSIMEADSSSNLGRISPVSDGYLYGMPPRSQDGIRERKPPTLLNSFALDVLNEMGENVPLDERLRGMLVEFIRNRIGQRRIESIDYDENRFLATRLFSDYSLTPQIIERLRREIRKRLRQGRKLLRRQRR